MTGVERGRLAMVYIAHYWAKIPLYKSRHDTNVLTKTNRVADLPNNTVVIFLESSGTSNYVHVLAPEQGVQGYVHNLYLNLL